MNSVTDISQSVQEFSPSSVFYDSPRGIYLVDSGRAYFSFGKKSPILTGIKRWRMRNGEHEDLAGKQAKIDLDNRELDGVIQWSGSIAGHKKGPALDSQGLPILIMTEANLPSPVAGSAVTISSIIEQAFPDPEPRAIFMGWLATRFKAVYAGIHTPAPMMVIAGEVNAGKSLLAWISGQVLGGRVANPYATWTGGMLWNDDLVSSELLLVDDCIASTDIRSRRHFGAAFKEAIYPPVVQLRKRNTSSISIRPAWAVMVCTNCTPEAVQIVPPIDADLADKVILLKASRIIPPIDTSSPEGRHALQIQLRKEMPAFAQFLIAYEVPFHLRDSRSGIKAWREPELAEAIEASSPARRLEELLIAGMKNYGIWHDLPTALSASEIEGRIMDRESPVREQARPLFSWHGAGGSALSKLASMGSPHVTFAEPDLHKKIKKYLIRR